MIVLVFGFWLTGSLAQASEYECELTAGFAGQSFKIKAPTSPFKEMTNDHQTILEHTVSFTFWPANSPQTKSSIETLYVSIEGKEGQHTDMTFDYPVRSISANFEVGNALSFHKQSINCALK